MVDLAALACEPCTDASMERRFTGRRRREGSSKLRLRLSHLGRIRTLNA
jgi:hypothetical protein